MYERDGTGLALQELVSPRGMVAMAARDEKRKEVIMDHHQLMKETLQELLGYEKRLAEACGLISGQFHEGKKEEGIQLLNQFLEGMGWLSKALILTRPLQIEEGMEIEIEGLTQRLGPLVEALENRDYNLVGDMLEYELQPLLVSWSQELAKTAPTPPVR